MVYTPHHYDDLALVIRRYFDWANIDLLGLSRKRRSSLLDAVVVGRQNSRLLFGQQIGSMVEESDTNLGIRPVLIGETGVPMDLEMDLATTAKPMWQRLLSSLASLSPFHTTSHRNSNSNNNVTTMGDRYVQQGTSTLFLQCFDNILQGLDRNLVHYTLWNYTAENTAEHGDHWNGENLSLFSSEQQRFEEEEEEQEATKINSPQSSSSISSSSKRRRHHPLDRGARALSVFCRPYPVVTVGTPVRLEFDRHQKIFQVWISTGVVDDAAMAAERLGTVIEQSHSTGGRVVVVAAAEEEGGICKEEHLARLASTTRLSTEIYIPEHHFGHNRTVDVWVSEGDWFWDRGQQILYWYYDLQDSSGCSRTVSLRMAVCSE
ncbi:hypothetical protein DFQ26_000387 [Actinomortierella ambigua]|nr:hypothetical protein DFQ26_000387 [Actinomortierella ambigua]